MITVKYLFMNLHVFSMRMIYIKPVKIYHTKHRAKPSGKLMSNLRISLELCGRSPLFGGEGQASRLIAKELSRQADSKAKNGSTIRPVGK